MSNNTTMPCVQINERGLAFLFIINFKLSIVCVSFTDDYSKSQSHHMFLIVVLTVKPCLQTKFILKANKVGK